MASKEPTEAIFSKHCRDNVSVHFIHISHNGQTVCTLAPYALAYYNSCPFLFRNTLLCRTHPPSLWKEEMVPVHPVTLQASGSIGGRRRGFLTKRGTPCVIAAAEPQDAPSQTDGSGTMDVAT